MALVNVRPIDPLQHGVPIVDAAGRPTPQFIRQWQMARTINLTTEELTVDLEALEARVATVETKLTSLQSEIDAAEARIAALEARAIIAGTGLTGGGDLTADRTLALADTTVAAGTYGSTTAYPQITVDAQGRITAASEIPK